MLIVDFMAEQGGADGSFFKQFVFGRYMAENGNDTIALDGVNLFCQAFNYSTDFVPL